MAREFTTSRFIFVGIADAPGSYSIEYRVVLDDLMEPSKRAGRSFVADDILGQVPMPVFDRPLTAICSSDVALLKTEEGV